MRLTTRQLVAYLDRLPALDAREGLRVMNATQGGAEYGKTLEHRARGLTVWVESPRAKAARQRKNAERLATKLSGGGELDG